MGRIEPGVPMATTTWSMIPQGAPTTWFSASWQSAASRRGSRSPAPRARAVATSSAALDETPTDYGKVGRDRQLRSGRLDHPVAHEDERDAEDVVGPLRPIGQGVAQLRVGQAGQLRDLVARRGGRVRRPSASAGSATTVVVSRVGVSSTSAPE